MNRLGRITSLLAVGALLTACSELAGPVKTSPAPPVRVDKPAEEPQSQTEAPPEVSERSRLLSVYYQRLQNEFLAQGMMRSDNGEQDAPFTDTMLLRNFVQIALRDEYVADARGLRAEETPASVRRWETPIRMNIEFGDTVGPDIIDSDRPYTEAFARRISRLTGVPIFFGSFAANFHVLTLTEDDRLAIGPQLRSLVPGIDENSVRYAVNLPRDQLCLVIGTFKPDGVTYDRAVAIVRAEHPQLMRQTCVHEELAQGMGLVNDSPKARPSIFNDDEEFGFLTPHDELLLKILYDKRLSVGMSETEAIPIVREIIADLLGGPV